MVTLMFGLVAAIVMLGLIRSMLVGEMPSGVVSQDAAVCRTEGCYGDRSAMEISTERREHARLSGGPLNKVPVTFYFGDTYGTGTLCDLSTDGCKVETCATTPVGTSLTLQLTVLRESSPLKIDAAIVRWIIKDQYFGAKFLQVEPTTRLLLDQCIGKFAVA